MYFFIYFMKRRSESKPITMFLLNLTEVCVANEMGEKGVIKYRKRKSANAAKETVKSYKKEKEEKEMEKKYQRKFF